MIPEDLKRLLVVCAALGATAAQALMDAVSKQPVSVAIEADQRLVLVGIARTVELKLVVVNLVMCLRWVFRQ